VVPCFLASSKCSNSIIQSDVPAFFFSVGVTTVALHSMACEEEEVEAAQSKSKEDEEA